MSIRLSGIYLYLANYDCFRRLGDRTDLGWALELERRDQLRRLAEIGKSSSEVARINESRPTPRSIRIQSDRNQFSFAYLNDSLLDWRFIHMDMHHTPLCRHFRFRVAYLFISAIYDSDSDFDLSFIFPRPPMTSDSLRIRCGANPSIATNFLYESTN